MQALCQLSYSPGSGAKRSSALRGDRRETAPDPVESGTVSDGARSRRSTGAAVAATAPAESYSEPVCWLILRLVGFVTVTAPNVVDTCGQPPVGPLLQFHQSLSADTTVPPVLALNTP